VNRSGAQTPKPEFALNAQSGRPATIGDSAAMMDPMACAMCQPMTIDLSNALALGGANNQQIALARARVIEANANWMAAKVLSLPTLRLGIGYNVHGGAIQATPGQMVNTTRSSLFVGGGSTLNNQISGGSGGPANIGLNLSLADAFFEPLVARRMRNAVCASKVSTINDELLAIGEAYFSLVESYALLATTQQALVAAEEIVHLTTDFSDAGKGSLAEVYRAQTERAFWQRMLQDDWRVMNVARAELARLLNLDCMVCLTPVEERITPVDLIPIDTPCDELIGIALRIRPEATEQSFRMAAARGRVWQEKLRPFLPFFQVGTNGGLFGANPDGFPTNYGGRGDFDAQATWEVQNLGFGNKAARCQRVGQLKQQQAIWGAVRNQICADVQMALAEVRSYRNQIELAIGGLETADRSYETNLQRIREDEGIPLELLQAIRARHEAQTGLTMAITDYNQSQFRLLRAVGQAPDAETTARHVVYEEAWDDDLGEGLEVERLEVERLELERLEEAQDEPVDETLPVADEFFQQAIESNGAD
jgi:outer membrane protein TolC